MIKADLGVEKLNDAAIAVAQDAMSFYGLPETLEIDIIAGNVGEHIEGEADAICFAREDRTGYVIIFDEELHYSLDRVCELVGHEMTHVKQYVKGEMQDVCDDGRTVKYRGRYYRNENELEYWLAPWEMEARAMQEFFLFRYHRG